MVLLDWLFCNGMFHCLFHSNPPQSPIYGRPRYSQLAVLSSPLEVKGKGAHEPKAHTARAHTGFHSMKYAQEYCYSPLDRMLVHHRVTPQQYVAGTHLYTWVKRDKVE